MDIKVKRLSVLSLLCGIAMMPVTARADVRNELLQKSLQYFLNETHQHSGLVRDRAPNFDNSSYTYAYDIASIASTGFGLSVVAHASKQGLISNEQGAAYVLRTLRAAACDPTTSEARANPAQVCLPRYRGWYYHFMDLASGKALDGSEVSTIDTALFLAGVLVADTVFKDNDEIHHLAQIIFSSVEFQDMMTDGGANLQKRTLSMGWFPSIGYLPYQWDSYAEQMVMLLLGIGHDRSPLPVDVWSAVARPIYPPSNAVGGDLPLFVHQYSHLYMNLKDHKIGAEDLFANSVKATAFNRSFCEEQKGFQTYSKGFWGLSASDSFYGYLAYSPKMHDGTVCLGCAVASFSFMRDVIVSDVERWITGEYAPRIYGRYGFVDGFNIDQNWFSPDVIGITVGSVYLALANEMSENGMRIWDLFEANPIVQLARARLH